MTTETRRAVSMFTDVFASDDSDAAARRTGFVTRPSQLTGKLFLALGPFGAWRDAPTTLAPWAAQATPWDEPVEVSPAAIQQRMNQRALACLQAMLRRALANGPSVDNVGAAGLLTACTKVYRAESTGVARPASRHALLPGSGGSAAPAGAKRHAVWDYTSRGCGHCALPPWHMPAQTDVDTGVAGAQTGLRFLCELGYFTMKAFARMAAAGAYFFRRLPHQPPLWHTVSGQVHPLALASWRATVVGARTEHAMVLGAKERVACRLVASRLPEGIGPERRRLAHQKAKPKG